MGNQGQLYFGLFLTSDNLLMAIILLSGFLALAVIISMMRIYKKCGKPAISAIIPIWGQIVLFQITGIAWWYIFIPIVNFVMMIKSYIILAKKFGKGSGFAIGMIFLPMIFIPLLSFYDYVDEEKDEISEEPIYNPFNQTNVEQVMPEAPIAPVASTVIDSSVNDGVLGETPVDTLDTQNNNIVEETTVTTKNEVLNENDDIFNLDNVIPENSVGENKVTEIPVIEEPILVENNIENVTIQNVANEVIKEEPTGSVIEPINQVEQMSNSIEVHDIENALNINKEPIDVAFNSIPVEDNVTKVEQVETIETTNNEVQEEVLELPEIAAKSCPACGVSLAENVNFCTSCGTKV